MQMIKTEELLAEFKEALIATSFHVRLETTYLCYNFIGNCNNQALIAYFIKNLDLALRLIENLGV